MTKQKLYNKRYRAEHPDYYIKWIKEHPEKMRTAWRKYNNKRKTDAILRLNHNITGSIYSALKGTKNGRRWEDLVGYTLAQLQSHLELLFQPGMSWDNYGEWHIDHIIPISLWDYSGAEDREFKQCWALCNLQPLWAKDNFRKGKRV